jgi:hypothetical protein
MLPSWSEIPLRFFSGFLRSTPVPALNGANTLRLRLRIVAVAIRMPALRADGCRGGRPLPRSPEHFQSENALDGVVISRQYFETIRLILCCGSIKF